MSNRNSPRRQYRKALRSLRGRLKNSCEILFRYRMGYTETELDHEFYRGQEAMANLVISQIDKILQELSVDNEGA